MGSGSTGVACKNTKRNFTGIEKNSEFFKLASERLNMTEDDWKKQLKEKYKSKLKKRKIDSKKE
jgi:DNA modification methylase